MRRVLITGSREGVDPGIVWAALSYELDFKGPFVLVHGACPSGVDKFAADWAAVRDIDQDPHPADWSQGRGGGPARNKRMVEAGADLCLAFIASCTRKECRVLSPHGSHGAVGCARLAIEAGIPAEVRLFGGLYGFYDYSEPETAEEFVRSLKEWFQ